MGITLLLGGEEFLADRVISEKIAKNKSSVLSQFEAGDLEVGAITDAFAPSLFGDQRLVIIKGIQDLTSEVSDELAEALLVEDDGLELVFWHKGGVKGKALLEKIKKLKPQTIACDVIKKESEKAEFIHS